MLNKRTRISENISKSNKLSPLNALAHMGYSTMSAAAGTILTIQVQVHKNKLPSDF